MSNFDPQSDPLLGRSCLSYQLQFCLPTEARAALADISSQLARHVPSGLWLAPVETLHVTCSSLISPRDDWHDKDQFWSRISPLVAESLRQIELQVPAFRLHFGALRVTDRAIVVLADHEPCVAHARAIVARLMPSPETKLQLQPDTIHASLCRYSEAARLPRDLPDLAADCQPDIWADIDTMVLVRETTYPSLRVETMMFVSLVRRALGMAEGSGSELGQAPSGERAH
jgi:hypothetical protein